MRSIGSMACPILLSRSGMIAHGCLIAPSHTVRVGNLDLFETLTTVYDLLSQLEVLALYLSRLATTSAMRVMIKVSPQVQLDVSLLLTSTLSLSL